MTERTRNSLIGDRAFYRKVFLITIPIIIQNGITTFVNLLDNIMVGQVGTEQMSGVAIANQLVFIFNLCIFGAVAGAGILGAQFFGSGNQAGLRDTFRFKIVSAITLSVVFFAIFIFCGDALIGAFLHEGEGGSDLESTLHYGKQYLLVVMAGLIPFALTQGYSGTLRETGQTTVPMAAGVTAVLVNLVLNYVLIFGHFGAPKLGVEGAALATVISRYVELLMVVCWTHLHKKICVFIQGAYRSIYIPASLLKRIAIKGMPLLLNEALWSGGMAFLNQCYSTCGLEVVPAMNISSTVFNLASVVFLSGGNSVGILMGQMLGAGNTVEYIRSSNRKLITANVLVGAVFGVLLASVSGVFPQIYNTTESIRETATWLICICAATMPVHSYLNATYFSLRSGGKTLITFIFDSGFMWCCMIPVAFVLSRFTDLPILPLYAICQCPDLLKCFLGAHMLKKGEWIQNLTT